MKKIFIAYKLAWLCQCKGYIIGLQNKGLKKIFKKVLTNQSQLYTIEVQTTRKQQNNNITLDKKKNKKKIFKKGLTNEKQLHIIEVQTTRKQH